MTCDCSVRNRAPACSTSSPMCRARAARPASPRSSSCPPTRRRSGRARSAIAAYRAVGRAPRGLSRRRGDRAARGDRRAPSGSIPTRIVCGAGSDELLNLLARAYLRRRRRGDLHQARLPGLSDRHARRRREAGRGAGERTTPPMSTPSWRAVTPTHQDRLPRQSQQSDRHLPAVRRGASGCTRGLPPHVLLVLDAAYAEYVRAQRLRGRHRAGRHHPTTSVMTRTFSKIYGLAALRLGWAVWAGARRRRAQPHPRAVQRQRAGDRRRHRRDRATRAHVERVARAQRRAGCAWLTEEIGKLGLEVTPSVAQFPAASISRRRKGKTAAGRRRVPARSAASILRRVAAYGLPERAAHDRRHRGGQPRWSSQRSPSSWATEPA